MLILKTNNANLYRAFVFESRCGNIKPTNTRDTKLVIKKRPALLLVRCCGFILKLSALKTANCRYIWARHLHSSSVSSLLSVWNTYFILHNQRPRGGIREVRTQRVSYSLLLCGVFLLSTMCSEISSKIVFLVNGCYIVSVRIKATCLEIAGHWE